MGEKNKEKDVVTGIEILHKNIWSLLAHPTNSGKVVISSLEN